MAKSSGALYERKTEYESDYRINVTWLLEKGREKVFGVIREGKGELEIQSGRVFLTFLNQEDKNQFLSALPARR
ncbi:MAG TPA: hypothetical protein VN944_11940 [Nitrospiria bacterium]|nr:hypothetical protein [Nitrospiria bacterium]